MNQLLAREVSTLGLLAAVLSFSCDGGPLAPEGCTIELDGVCWTLLGLDSEWVAEIAVTPWGTFVGTNDHGIFRLDSDRRWTALGPKAWYNHLIPKALLYVPAEPPRLLAGVYFRRGSQEDTTAAAVFASYDRGRSWVPSDDGLETNPANKFYPYRVYAEDLEVDPGDPRRVYMSNPLGVLRSLDAGQGWEFVFGDFSLFWQGLPDVMIDPQRSGRIWVAGEGAVFNPLVGVSPDWGETWTGGIPKCNGIVWEGPVYALALDPNVPSRLWAAVAGSAQWADDGAEAQGLWQCGPGPQGDVVAFAVLDGALYALSVFLELQSDGKGGVIELTQMGVYRTRDGGATWDALPVPPGALGATAAGTDSAQGRLLIGTRAGLWALRP